MTELWTKEMVAERLIDAADILKHLPEERVRGYFNTWPAIVYSFDDLVGQERRPMRRPLPSPQAIDDMEATMLWLGWLEPDIAKLAWARAEHTRWKEICWRFGVSRATANRRWEYALSVIAWRLSGRKVPAKQSSAAFLERSRAASVTS